MKKILFDGTIIEEKKPKYLRFNDDYFLDDVNEGLITTYRAESVKDIVCRKFNISEECFQIDKDYKTIGLYLKTTMDSNTIGEIENYMRTCGYHSARKRKLYTEDGVSYYFYLFEPKFSEDITDSIKTRYKYLYHATPSICVNKILKKGLVPRSKNSMFTYPDRIYFMLGDNLNEEQLKVLCRVRALRFRKQSNIIDNNDYSILRIDLSQVGNSVKFYVDPFADEAIYTFENVSPKAISICGKISGTSVAEANPDIFYEYIENDDTTTKRIY